MDIDRSDIINMENLIKAIKDFETNPDVLAMQNEGRFFFSRNTIHPFMSEETRKELHVIIEQCEKNLTDEGTSYRNVHAWRAFIDMASKEGLEIAVAAYDRDTSVVQTANNTWLYFDCFNE